jgi:phosphomannomutase
MSEIKFGTDGWRGRIADDYTFANVRRCAEGYARYIRATSKATQPAVVIGYDKRFQSEDFAAAAAEVLAGHGIKVWLTAGPTPTPVIAFAVGAQKADGAINITASHNPRRTTASKCATIPAARSRPPAWPRSRQPSRDPRPRSRAWTTTRPSPKA